jgi:hypothetical protein
MKYVKAAASHHVSNFGCLDKSTVVKIFIQRCNLQRTNNILISVICFHDKFICLTSVFHELSLLNRKINTILHASDVVIYIL